MPVVTTADGRQMWVPDETIRSQRQALATQVVKAAPPAIASPFTAGLIEGLYPPTKPPPVVHVSLAEQQAEAALQPPPWKQRRKDVAQQTITAAQTGAPALSGAFGTGLLEGLYSQPPSKPSESMRDMLSVLERGKGRK